MSNDLSDRHHPLKRFAILLAVYVGLSVAASAGANKIVNLPWGSGASVTVFVFLATVLLQEVIIKLHGKDLADLALSVSLIATIIAVVVFALAAAAPPAPYWLQQESEFNRQQAYQFVLGPTFRFVAAGFAAKTVSGFLQNHLSDKLKNRDSVPVDGPAVLQSQLLERPTTLLTRLLNLVRQDLVSPLFCQLIDTAIFVPIAFFGQAPLLPTAAGQYFTKAVLMIVLFPILKPLVLSFTDWLEKQSRTEWVRKLSGLCLGSKPPSTKLAPFEPNEPSNI